MSRENNIYQNRFAGVEKLRRPGRKGRGIAHVLFCALVLLGLHSAAQQQPRTTLLLSDDWYTMATDTLVPGLNPFEQMADNRDKWQKVTVPHTWDKYEGYRRLRHGNRHGYAYYTKQFSLPAQPHGKRVFLFFEGVGSYATVWLNGKKVGFHAGGRTSFTLDVTDAVNKKGGNVLHVRADHPAGIQDLPWVCGGCSDERGFSEGSQPMGIFRPVHLVFTNDLRIEPFGVHIWNDTSASAKSVKLFAATEVKNYSNRPAKLTLITTILNRKGQKTKSAIAQTRVAGGTTAIIKQAMPELKNPTLWSLENPYLYSVITEIREGGKLVDSLITPYGIRTVQWPVGGSTTRQFFLNGSPVFINGIAEYEHLLGNSHAFTPEQIKTRVAQIKAAGFNAFRDAHQPHNLRYQEYWDNSGLLWWTQMSAHAWYDTKAFRENFKTLLQEWVKERRNSPSLVMWGLQNESKLPEDFARECTEIIRQMDPTASSQRLVTTCNGGSGTDWDVPQNWTGTYGGNPATYGEDLMRQVLVGEYGAWRTLDLHTEGPFQQNGAYSEDRICQLMELKVALAEKVKDSAAGHFMWLLTSHDNPGRVQGGEGLRELDRVGPVNYKGLLTPWEEPLDVFYMFRSNYASKATNPMVYIASHTWPDRWVTPGKKDGIIVYSNCDEVELFNDVNHLSLGKRKRKGPGTHFRWDDADIRYNVLFAVGYVNGKIVAKDRVDLHHLPNAPHAVDTVPGWKERNLTAPRAGYRYLYRVNCGGPAFTDANGNHWLPDRERLEPSTWGSRSWTANFPGMPPFFASQRRISDRVNGTPDDGLFQSFRFGRDNLHFDFPVPDGNYLVELYFTEPWAGTGGGLKAGGWRQFDVAINNRIVLKNLDIWKESGRAGALKKTVRATVSGGMLSIHFPRVASGQAVISAVAIATTSKNLQPAPAPLPLMQHDGSFNKEVEWRDWLTTGEEAFWGEKVCFRQLPPEVYGAQWLKANRNRKENFRLRVLREADVFLAVDSADQKGLPSFAQYEPIATALQLGDGTAYKVIKKRLHRGEFVSLPGGKNVLVMAVPASYMEPAYDLKPVASYKAIDAVLSGVGLVKGKLDGKDRVIFEKASAENKIKWKIAVGVGDQYSLTVSYNNPTGKMWKGHMQLVAGDGTLMREEEVEMVPTRPGKSAYINATTGSMINAGNYWVVLSSPAEGIAVNALDIQ